MKISIVIPALNEEEAIGNTIKSIPLEELKKNGLETEIIVVDNGSEDNTAEIARNSGATVIYEPNKGYGNAYLKGFKEATGEIIVIGDADGTYPFEIIPEFIRPILDNEAEFVIGSRLRGKIQDGAMNWLHRYIGNPLLTGTLNILFHTRISDTHCGMRAFTKNALDKMNLKTPGMEFASEMVIEAARKELKIKEIPIKYRKRYGGKPKLSSFEDGWRHLRFMMLYSPTILFLIPGFLLFFSGLFLILLLLAGPIKLIGNLGLDIHPMILGNFLVILGFQVIILGIYTKVFSIVRGIIKPGRFMSFFLKYNSLEIEMLIGLFIFIIGLIAATRIIYNWITTGFGPLSELRTAILASTLMFLGIQIIFSALFLSVLLLERKDLG